jgi:hypothetical protein
MRLAAGGEREEWWKRGGQGAMAPRRRGFSVRNPETAGQDHRKIGTLTSVCRGGTKGRHVPAVVSLWCWHS